LSNADVYQKHEANFFVAGMSMLVYETMEVFAEAGIVFLGRDGTDLLVAAGVSPGSVSMAAPFSDKEFNTEFELDDYRREKLLPGQTVRNL
jgi:hypothetical protein